MAIRKIRVEDDPILRKKSRPVENFDEKLFTLLDDMKETLLKADGIGLAAVQVGMLKRVVIINYDGRYLELINPEISLPHKAGKTCRPQTVTVKAQNREGKWCLYSGSDLMARCFCHELDHLDGILYTDRLAPGEKVFLTEDAE